MYNIDDINKLQQEVSAYRSENEYHITKHFKKKTYGLFPMVRLAVGLASIVVVFLVAQQTFPLSYSESPNIEQNPQDMVGDKASGESLGANDIEPTRLANKGIYTVIEQSVNTDKKGYDIVFQSENGRLDYFSTDKLILNQSYYFLNDNLYKAQYENGTWSYQMNNTWYKVNP